MVTSLNSDDEDHSLFNELHESAIKDESSKLQTVDLGIIDVTNNGLDPATIFGDPLKGKGCIDLGAMFPTELKEVKAEFFRLPEDVRKAAFNYFAVFYDGVYY